MATSSETAIASGIFGRELTKTYYTGGYPLLSWRTEKIHFPAPQRYDLKENMSDIRDRVNDALLLWNQGRREGAFLVALIAVAAAARQRYSILKDREGFEHFLRDCHSVRLSVEYRGNCEPIEHIFYKWFRCQLVHEGMLPIDIEFIETDEMTVRAGGAPEYVLKVSYGWFHHMIRSVLQTTP